MHRTKEATPFTMCGQFHTAMTLLPQKPLSAQQGSTWPFYMSFLRLPSLPFFPSPQLSQDGPSFKILQPRQGSFSYSLCDLGRVLNPLKVLLLYLKN